MEKHEMASQKKIIFQTWLDLFQEYRGWIEATETWILVADGETGYIKGIFIDEGWEGKENRKKEKHILGYAFYSKRWGRV